MIIFFVKISLKIPFLRIQYINPLINLTSAQTPVTRRIRVSKIITAGKNNNRLTLYSNNISFPIFTGNGYFKAGIEAKENREYKQVV